MNLNQHTAVNLIKMMESGKVEARDIINDTLQRIADVDKKVKAFIDIVDRETLLEKAEVKKVNRKKVIKQILNPESLMSVMIISL